jgi:hypothetical protein
MGATTAFGSARANNINQAWNRVYEECKEEYGYDPYNGTLSTCEFTKDVSYKLQEMNEQKLEEWIIDNCPKREAWGYCTNRPVKNTNKIKSIVKANPQKGTRKWVTKYAVYRYSEFIKSFKTQTEAVKYARQQLKNWRVEIGYVRR